MLALTAVPLSMKLVRAPRWLLCKPTPALSESSFRRCRPRRNFFDLYAAGVLKWVLPSFVASAKIF